METSCRIVLFCVLIILQFINGCLCVKQQQDEHSRALPFCRSKNDAKTRGHNRSLVIVSTLDGLVSAINAKDGQVVWSFLTGPDTMLSSSISKVQMSNNGKWMRLIPSLDGSLYKFDGTSIEALPISADSLLRSSLKLADDSVISGCNENRVYGINYENGKLRYVCNATGCQNYASVYDDDAVIVIRRRTQTVRAVDPRTGFEKWNYSVGQHELAFIDRVSDSCGLSEENDEDEDSFYENLNVKFITPEGRVIGVAQNDPKNILWQKRFDSPVIDAWSLHQRNLEQMDLLSTVHMPTHHVESNHIDLSATFFIGIHDKQLYIKQSRSMLNKITRGVLYGESEFPRIQWKPYLVTALSRTPVLVGDNAVDSYSLTYLPSPGAESTALMVRQDSEYPYDGGFYIFPEETSIDNLLTVSNDTNGDEDETLQVVVIASLSYWWKELTITGFIFIAVNFLVTRYFWTRRMSAKLNSVENNNNSLLKSDKELPVISLESSLNQNTAPATGEFTSSYLKEFEPIQCLGRGGFGVVFQARKKMDECDYAVKRIGIPNRKDAKEIVMREVKVLAKLDHVGIVRYFNAWLESPPAGWQENIDKLWEQKGLLTKSTIHSEYSTDVAPDKKNANNINPLQPYRDSFVDTKRGNHSSFGFSLGGGEPLPAEISENKIKNNPLFRKPGSTCSDEDFADDDDEDEDNLCSKYTTKSHSLPFENYDDKLFFNHDSESLPAEINENKIKSAPLFVKPGSTCSDEDSADGLTKSQILHKYEESSSDFIVFQDSGCGDYKSSSTENIINNNNDDEDGDNFTTVTTEQQIDDVRRKKLYRSSTSEGSSRVSKTSKSRPLWRPNSLSTSIRPTSPKPPSVPRMYLYIQMQLCKKENLKDWLLQNTERDKVEMFNIFDQIVCAVEYIHGQGLMHRDLKPSNIFFALDGSVKVGDLGLVAATMADETHKHTPFGDGPNRVAHTDNVGTKLYMSPEQLGGQVYSHKVDIFSLGLIFFELINPFNTDTERYLVLSALRKHVFPENVVRQQPDECTFVKQMLSQDPESRPSATEIRDHSLFQYLEPQPEILRKRHSRNVSRTISTSSTSSSGSSSGLKKEKSNKKIYYAFVFFIFILSFFIFLFFK